MIWTLLTLSLWATAWGMLPFTYANPFWTPKAMLWLVGSWAIATSGWFDLPTRTWSHWRLGWVLGWVCLLFAWKVVWPQVLIPNSNARLIQVPWVLYPILPTLIGVGSLLALKELVQQTDTLERWAEVAHTLCWIGTTIAIYGLLQACYLDPLHIGPRSMRDAVGAISPNALVTTFGNPGVTAGYLALIVPFSLMFKPSRFLVMYGLMSTAIVLIQSSTALLAWEVSSVLMLFFLKRYWSIVGLLFLGLVAVGWIIGHHHLGVFLNPNGRYQMWATLLHAWKEHPLMGFGLGATEYGFVNNLWNFVSPHNELIQILFETGLVGAVLTLWALWETGQKVWRTTKTLSLMAWLSSALSFLILSLLYFPLRIGTLLAVGVCIWAALEAHTQEGSHVRIPA